MILKSLLILPLLCALLQAEEIPARRKLRMKAQPKQQPTSTEYDLSNIEDADLQAAWEREKKTRWSMPGLGVSAPGGFGANWGDVYAGVFFASRTLSTTSQISDGVVFTGFGIGNSDKWLGIETSYTVTDLDPFLKDSTLSFKVHRYLGKNWSVAVGAESAFVFGEGIDGVENYYLCLSKAITLKEKEEAWFSSLLFSAGAGTGRFRPYQDQLSFKNSIGYFASAGVRVLQPFGISLGWSGYGADLGLSITPFRSFRMTVNLGYKNILTTYGPGLPRVFDLSLVYSDSFFEDTFPFFSARANR